MTQDERYRLMTESNLHTLIPKMAIPTIISMLVTSVYNLADTYFVSKISTEASAAVGVIFSLMALIQALGFTIGIGSATYVSRLLGQKNREEADRTVSTAFFTALVIGTLFATVGLIFREKIVTLLGAIPEVHDLAVDYATYIFIGAPFMMGLYVLNNQMRAQGSAVLSMIGVLTGCVLNIGLDPLLIFVFRWGIAGAAIATVFSQFLSFCILLILNNRVKNIISVKFKTLRPSLRIYKEILHNGFPSLCRQGLASLSGVALNFAAGSFGAAALSALSIVNRFMSFLYSALIGYGQGFQPVCGFNFGAKRYDRVLESYRFSLKVGVILISVLGIVAYIAAPQVMTWFRADDPQVIDVGVKALRAQCFTLPLQAFMMLSQFLCQSIGYGIRAAVIAMGRQGLFLIPAYLILAKLMQVNGLIISQPCSDVLTAILAGIIIVGVLKRLKTLAEEQPSLQKI
ncbi:MAG: MATE family efflux transporter [Clostridia bacterium]|nr:MATE family efflux transporter [Clostridia bacterium]MBQ1965872.1 MATE family efflux transporter [Clostridia bacterium]